MADLKDGLTAVHSQSATSISSSHKSRTKSKPKSTFQSAVYAHLDNPLTSLFRLGVRVLQLIFALSSGISYAIELSHEHHDSAIIYSQVVFALTIITLIIDAVTLRSYRLTFAVESTICVLWLALFGVFYNIYLDGQEPSAAYDGVDMGRMKRAVWIDLINFLLWFASAAFSTVMCCSGIKGAIKGKLERRREKGGNGVSDAARMEEGVLRESSRRRERREDRLPMYEEIVAAARAG